MERDWNRETEVETEGLADRNIRQDMDTRTGKEGQGQEQKDN